MKRSRIPTYSAFAGLLFASAFASHQAEAASASTGPLGYTTIECLWASDTLCSTAGITLAPEFVGKATGAPAGDVLTVDASPGWGADVFANTHYVRFTSGAKAGRYYTVTANGANTLTLDPAGDDLSTVATDDGLKLVEYWTLDTLFPPADQSTIVPSGGNLGFQRRTEVLFPDLEGDGINLSSPADKKYFMKTEANGGWTAASGFGAAGSTRILPDMYFIVRHPAASQSGGLGDVDGTEFVPLGHVDDNPTTVILSSQPTGSGSQDNSVALSRPVAVALGESNLLTSGAFQGSAGALGFQRRDELLVFDLDVDTITLGAGGDDGINRASVAKYYVNNNFDPDGAGPEPAGPHWVNATNGNTLADNELALQPGSGAIIRKYNTASGASTFWVFDPSNPNL